MQKRGGAMKKTTDQRFVHVLCALFVKETVITDKDTMEPVDVSKVKDKPTLKCEFCSDSYGTLQCGAKKCKKVIHASCGFENGCLKEESDDNELITFVGFCKEHAPAEQTQNKRLSSDNLKQAVTNKVSTQLKKAALEQNSRWLREKLNDNDMDDCMIDVNALNSGERSLIPKSMEDNHDKTTHIVKDVQDPSASSIRNTIEHLMPSANKSVSCSDENSTMIEDNHDKTDEIERNTVNTFQSAIQFEDADFELSNDEPIENTPVHACFKDKIMSEVDSNFLYSNFI